MAPPSLDKDTFKLVLKEFLVFYMLIGRFGKSQNYCLWSLYSREHLLGIMLHQSRS